MNSEVKTSRIFGSRTRGVAGKLIGLLIVAIAAGVVAVLAVALPPRTRDLPPADPPPVDVKVQLVRALPEMPDTFLLHGVVTPNRVVKVAAEVSGQIKLLGRRKTNATWGDRIFTPGGTVAEGEPVTKGDPLVLLNTDLLQAEYDRAKAQADYDQREHTRMTELYNSGVATQTGLDQMKTKMDVSQAALVTAGERLRRAVIEAPISGVLNCLPEEVGQYVQTGTCVAEIVDMSITKVVVEVPEKDVHYLKVTDKARVLIDPRGGREVGGEITFISELADDKAHTTRVEVLVQNPRHVLRSGQIVRVRLTRRVLTNVIMIPLEAVIPLERGRVVYVVNGETAERREVEIGFMKGRNVSVLRGLDVGDRLIVEGHRFVGPGQKVRLVNPARTTPPTLAPTTKPGKK